MHEPLPPGASGARVVADIPVLHRLLRCAFQLGKSLPDELLHLFTANTAHLPRTTEAERLVIQRVGQDILPPRLAGVLGRTVRHHGPCGFRTSAGQPHQTVGPCAIDAERLDVFNGLLLAPHLDAAFDQGFITVADTGEVIVSSVLDEPARQLLGLASPLSLRASLDNHRAYLSWHRQRVFKSTTTPTSDSHPR